MPRRKRRNGKGYGVQLKPSGRFCVSCNRAINKNAFNSQKLNKQCHKCYSDNTNKSVKRKHSKKDTVQRRKDNTFKYNRNNTFIQ